MGDLNADGWDDIFIASGMSYPYRYGINSLLLNDRGKKFDDAEFVLGIEPRKSLYTPWFEIDCSDPQERAAQEKLDSKVCVGQSGKSIVMAPRSSRSSVIFDLDNDGDLDIVTNDFNSEPQVLVSDLAQRKKIHWLKISLRARVQIAMGSAQPYVCALAVKLTPSTTMASLAIWRKVFCRFTSVLERLPRSTA